MTEAQQMQDESLRAQEDVKGNQTFVYRGQTWPCLASGLKRGMALGLGAPVEQLGRVMIVRKSAMRIRTADQNEDTNPDPETADNDVMPPHPGKSVLFDSRQYEIESVDEDGDGVTWIVRLISPNS